MIAAPCLLSLLAGNCPVRPEHALSYNRCTDSDICEGQTEKHMFKQGKYLDNMEQQNLTFHENYNYALRCALVAKYKTNTKIQLYDISSMS